MRHPLLFTVLVCAVSGVLSATSPPLQATTIINADLATLVQTADVIEPGAGGRLPRQRHGDAEGPELRRLAADGSPAPIHAIGRQGNSSDFPSLLEEFGKHDGASSFALKDLIERSNLPAEEWM